MTKKPGNRKMRPIIRIKIKVAITCNKKSKKKPHDAVFYGMGHVLACTRPFAVIGRTAAEPTLLEWYTKILIFFDNTKEKWDKYQSNRKTEQT